MPDWLPRPELSASPSLTSALLAAAAALAIVVVLLLLRRRRREPQPHQHPQAYSATSPRRESRALETLLTVAAAGIATAVAVSGMYKVFGDALGFDGASLIFLCAFLEIALMVSAIRARRSLRDTGTVGVDGAAVWVLALMSAVLAAADADNWLGRAVRFSAPLVAAWLWERGMAPDRRQHRASAQDDVEERTRRQRIAWRWTRERLAVALRLADPVARTTTEVDRARRLATLTHARIRLAVLEAEHPRWIRLLLMHPVRAQVARALLQRQALAAVEHLSLGTDPAVTRQIRTTVAAVVGLAQATSPDNVHSASPWELDRAGEGQQDGTLEESAEQRRRALDEALAREELERRRALDEVLTRIEQEGRRALEVQQARVQDLDRRQQEEAADQEQRRQAFEAAFAEEAAARRRALDEALAKEELERRRALDEDLARIERQVQAARAAEELAAEEVARQRAAQERAAQERAAQERAAERAAQERVGGGQRSGERERVRTGPPAPRSAAGRRPVPDAPAGVPARRWAEVLSWYRAQRAAGCAEPPPAVPEQVWAWYLSETQAGRVAAPESVWASTWQLPRSTAGTWRRACRDAKVELKETPRLELVAAATA